MRSQRKLYLLLVHKSASGEHLPHHPVVSCFADAGIRVFVQDHGFPLFLESVGTDECADCVVHELQKTGRIRFILLLAEHDQLRKSHTSLSRPLVDLHSEEICNLSDHAIGDGRATLYLTEGRESGFVEAERTYRLDIGLVGVFICLPCPQTLVDSILSTTDVHDPLFLCRSRSDANGFVGITRPIHLRQLAFWVTGNRLAGNRAKLEADFLNCGL